MISLEKLFQAGVHFGHQKKRWCPKMACYIWGHKNNIHLIDIAKTAQQLERSAQFLKQLAADGKTILWVGTKKPAQEIIRATGTELEMPFVSHRWIGGTLSNFPQVKKSVTKYLHFNDVIEKSDKQSRYTKKELSTMMKSAEKLGRNVSGIVDLTWPVGALVVVDVIKEASAIREAASMGVPVVALVDTNADPSLITYVIPCNDDSPRAIKVVVDYLAEAAKAGAQEFEQLKADQKQQREAQRALKAKEEKEIQPDLARILDESDEEETGKKAAGAKTAEKRAPRRPMARTSGPKRSGGGKQ
jgi:small subunit ribosomal protein S2